MAAFVARIDRWTLRIDKFTVDPVTGYLTVDGTASRVGVLEYGEMDGVPNAPWFELVPLETLNNDSFLAAMQSLPITLGHPPIMLDAANTRSYQRGTVTRSWMDGDDQRVRMLFTDADTIAAIRDGTKELSLGYLAKLDETPGKFRGRAYNASQIERRPNHLAIVDLARAGHGAKIDRMDGALYPRVDGLRVSKMDEVEVEIGGVRYKVAQPVADQLAALQEKVAAGDKPAGDADGDTSDNAGADGAANPASDEKDEKDEKDGNDAPRGDAAPAGITEAQLDARLDAFSTKLIDKMGAQRRKDAQAAEVRATLIERATKVLPESFKCDGKSTSDIMAAAVIEAAPDLKAAVEGARKDEKILTGLFEAAMIVSRPIDGTPPRVGNMDSGSQSDPIEAARLRQSERRDVASRTINVIGFEAARQRQDAAAKAAEEGAK